MISFIHPVWKSILTSNRTERIRVVSVCEDLSTQSIKSICFHEPNDLLQRWEEMKRSMNTHPPIFHQAGPKGNVNAGAQIQTSSLRSDSQWSEKTGSRGRQHFAGLELRTTYVKSKQEEEKNWPVMFGCQCWREHQRDAAASWCCCSASWETIYRCL